MNRYQEDITLGKQSEDEVFELLKNKYDDLERTTGYATFDYKTRNKKLKIELKTRRNDSTKYPTTMIGNNKIKKCKNPDTTYLFIFKFTDKLMFIKYDDELFKTFEIKEGGRYDRKRSGELSDYLYIPINCLTPLEDL